MYFIEAISYLLKILNLQEGLAYNVTTFSFLPRLFLENFQKNNFFNVSAICLQKPFTFSSMYKSEQRN